VRITGELAFSHGLHNPGFFGPAQQKDEPYGARLRIGRLLGTGDTWWPCSEEPDRLRNELGELIELLRAHAEAFFRTCKVHALARMS
jgi:hypothetical protein